MQLADARVSERPLFSERDRWFESAFLQRRVGCKPDLRGELDRHQRSRSSLPLLATRSKWTITTTPNELCAQLHNRMPVVLKPNAWPVWLGEEPAEACALKALLRPIPSGGMTCWPVNARVGNVKYNDASLIEPIAA